MIKKMILLPVIALSMSFSTLGFANIQEKENGKCPCMYKQQMKEMKDKLNLTEEQKKQIDQIKEEAKKEKKEYYNQAKDLKKQMRDLVASEKVDEAKLDQVVNEKKELVGKKTKLKLHTMNKVYNVLNADQKAKFSAMLEKWQEKKMDKMKKMLDEKDGENNDDMDDDD